MTLSKARVVNELRERATSAAQPQEAQTLGYHADVIEGIPGETLGEALHETQLQRQSLMRTKHRSLVGGVGLISVAALDFAFNTAAVSGLHTLGRMALVFGGGALIARGGMTGDKVDSTWRRQAVLTHWTQRLRHEGSEEHLPRQAELVKDLAPGREQSNTRAELLRVLNAVQEALAEHPERPGWSGALAQVKTDRQQIEKAPGESLAEVRQNIASRKQVRNQVAMGCLAAAGVSTLSAMFIPHVGFAGVIGMAGLMTAGIFVQDGAGKEDALLDTLARWELNLEDLKDSGWLVDAGKTSAPGGIEVEESFIQVGGVRVPVKR